MAASACALALARVNSCAGGCVLRESEDKTRLAAADYNAILFGCGLPQEEKAEQGEDPVETVRLTSRRGSKGPGPLVRSFNLEGLLAHAVKRERAVASMAAWQLLVAADGYLGVAFTLVTGTPHNLELREERVGPVPAVPCWDEREPPEIVVRNMELKEKAPRSLSRGSREPPEEGPEPVIQPHACLALSLRMLEFPARLRVARLLLLLMSGSGHEVKRSVDEAALLSCTEKPKICRSVVETASD